MERKFEVTQFYPQGIPARYFVKLHKGVFTKLELWHLQKLRGLLAKKFPQRKTTENPAKWRLTVESHNGEMTGRLSVVRPDKTTWSGGADGTVEVVCQTLEQMLAAAM